ncbi:MAG: phosphate ABC transporter ATP-binding protein PstB [Candidatus Hadarchaeales archaeon]
MKDKIKIKNLNVWFGEDWILKNINMRIPENKITAIIGPSGCGKTTLLKTINRLVEMFDSVKVSGDILLDGKSIYSPKMDLSELRQKIGIVFQKPNPFPKSIFENVSYGLKINGGLSGKEIHERVEEVLKKVGLWDEVKNKLDSPALALSGGQQQRLCIARALAVEPEVLLMDEPCSALDPISTWKIENLIYDLKKNYTIVIVTHNIQQAARISDYVAFLYLGKLVEFGTSRRIFKNARNPRTRFYIKGKFG